MFGWTSSGLLWPQQKPGQFQKQRASAVHLTSNRAQFITLSTQTGHPTTAPESTSTLLLLLCGATGRCLTGIYARILPPGAAVLELCASAHSHLPETLQAPRLMVGQGMNSNEMAANPSLHQHFLQVRVPHETRLVCSA